MPTVRRATPEDGAFLQEMLAIAADWRPDAHVRSVPELMSEPALAHYVAGWPADGDVGFVVEDGPPVGTTWWRFFPEHDPGYGFVNDATPECRSAWLRELGGKDSAPSSSKPSSRKAGGVLFRR